MYAITGAAGNTGGHVARTILARGEKVRAIGRNADHLRSLTAKGAEAVICDLTDATALAKAFSGAKAVYAMIPPNLTSQDYPAYQNQVIDSIASAIERSGVKHAVTLSSIGADKAEKTGPVLGLHRLEQRLNTIRSLNVLHIRAGYFMENTLAQIGAIKIMGKTAGTLRPDLRVPMIATRDIGAATAERLLKLDFKGQTTRELLGQRDISMAEVTRIIGHAINRPDLAYAQISDEQFRTFLVQNGISANVAGLLIEMAASLNSGHMKALETRSPQNTTATSYETFVSEEFASRYKGKSASA